MADRSLLLPQLIEDLAVADPNRVFIRDVRGEQRSYLETHENALRWAGLLRDQGVAPGDAVLSLLPTSITAGELWLGAGWLGAVLIPINIEYRGNSLKHAVHISGARILVTTSALIAECQKHPEIVEQLDRVILIDGEPADTAVSYQRLADMWPADAPATSEFEPPLPSNPAAVLFTSGTTGASKGVTLPWAQLQACAERYFPPGDFSERDVYYAPFPLFHLSGLVALNIMALCGGSVVIRDRFKTDEFWKDVNDFGCTTTLLLGAMVEFLVSTPSSADDAQTPLNKVCMIPVHPKVDEFRKRFQLKTCTNYGASETGSILVSDWNPTAARSCGHTRPEYEVRLVDEFDREVPVGTIGECVARPREPWLSMTAYWNMPEASLEVFRNQWVHTGDLLYRDEDGNFFYVDRKTDSLRRRGENISSLEVEAEINAHGEVVESAVVGVDSEFGEQEVFAAVVLASGSNLKPSALIEFLEPRMARYALPRYIEFVDALPKTTTQKVQKGEIRKRGVQSTTWDRYAL